MHLKTGENLKENKRKGKEKIAHKKGKYLKLLHTKLETKKIEAEKT